MEFGYIRVSTRSQTYARQLELLKNKAPDIAKNNIYHEKKSGSSTKNRTELRKLLQTVRAGDVIYIHSIDRLGRNLMDILQIINLLDKKQVRLVSISQGIDSSTPTGKMFIMVCGMMAEIELLLIKERTAEGVGIAKRNKKMGRPKKVLNTTETLILDDYLERRKTATECMELLKISRATFFRRLQEYKDIRALEEARLNKIRAKVSYPLTDEITDDTVIDF